MCLVDDWQAIVGLHVAVAAAESNAEARHATIEPFVVAQAQRLTQPIADTARSQLELFGDALADQQRHRHPLRRHPVGPRRLMLALVLVVFRSACIGHQPLRLLGFWVNNLSVYVVLATRHEVLQHVVELLFIGTVIRRMPLCLDIVEHETW